MLTAVNEDGTTPSGSSLLDEIVREGARRMLAAALEAEVNAYIAELSGERGGDGRRLVVRNGYNQPRRVTTVAGAVEVKAPRVNDKRVDEATGERKRFSSAILPPWCRSPRGSARCCRCSTCTVCPPVTSCPRWSSSSLVSRPVARDGDAADRAVAGRPHRVPGP